MQVRKDEKRISSGRHRVLYGIGILSFLCFVTLLSYLITVKLTETDKALVQSNVVPVKQGENQSPSASGVRLIYGYEAKTGDIMGLVLEVWDRGSASLAYLTIPTDTGYTVSAELYRRLIGIEQTVPQMMRFYNLYHYYEKETAWECGVPVIEELVGADIADYIVLNKKEWRTYFRKTENGVWKLRKSFLAEREKHREMTQGIDKGTADDGETLVDMPEWKPRIWSSNRVQSEDVRYYLLPGEQKNAGYEVNRKEMTELLTQIKGVLETNGKADE